MNAYNIFLKKTDKEIKKVIFVKIGFNTYPLIFNLLWYLYNKMIILSIFIMIFYYFVFKINFYLFLVSYLVISILSSIYGDKLLIKFLIYIEDCKYLGISEGNNLREVKMNFFNEYNKETQEKNK